MLSTFVDRTWEKPIPLFWNSDQCFWELLGKITGQLNKFLSKQWTKVIHTLWCLALNGYITEQIVWFKISWINTVRAVTMEMSMHNTWTKVLFWETNSPISHRTYCENRFTYNKSDFFGSCLSPNLCDYGWRGEDIDKMAELKPGLRHRNKCQVLDLWKNMHFPPW